MWRRLFWEPGETDKLPLSQPTSSCLTLNLAEYLITGPVQVSHTEHIKNICKSSCLHRASIASKTLFIVLTDAHYNKNHRTLQKFKIITLAPTCFGSRRNHHQGAVPCLAKTTRYGFSVLVGIDTVNVMAAYKPVVQAYGSQCELHATQQADMLP